MKKSILILLAFILSFMSLAETVHTSRDKTENNTYRIKAIAPAKVAYVGKFSENSDFLFLDHYNGYFTMYFGLSKGALLVKENEEIENGRQIAAVDSRWLANGFNMELVLGEADDVLSFLAHQYDSKNLKIDSLAFREFEEMIYETYYADDVKSMVLRETLVQANVIDKPLSVNGTTISRFRQVLYLKSRYISPNICGVGFNQDPRLDQQLIFIRDLNLDQEPPHGRGVNLGWNPMFGSRFDLDILAREF